MRVKGGSASRTQKRPRARFRRSTLQALLEDELDVHELEATSARHTLGDGPHGLDGALRYQAVSPQKKEWGEPTLVKHPELEQPC